MQLRTGLKILRILFVLTLYRFVGGHRHFRGHAAFTFRVEVCRFQNRQVIRTRDDKRNLIQANEKKNDKKWTCRGQSGLLPHV
jgi:hypothetical protein